MQLISRYELPKKYGEYHCLQGNCMGVSIARQITKNKYCVGKKEYVLIVMNEKELMETKCLI